MIDLTDDGAVRAALQLRLAELDAGETTNADSRDRVILDQTSVGRLSRMDAIQTQAMARAGQERRAMERHRILGALSRLDAGEFGACVRCGEDIDPRRVAIDLTTPTCISCAPG